MRVLINAAAANTGGAATYLENVLGELATLAADDHFVVVAPREAQERLAPVLENPLFSQVVYPHPPLQNRARIIYDQRDIRRLLGEHRIHVLFSANGFGTFFAPCPQALLLRNPIFFSEDTEARYREFGESVVELRLRRFWSRLSILASDVVMFPTAAMRDMVADFANFDRRDAQFIHYGFKQDLFFREAPVPEVVEEMRAWREAGHRLILAVSGYAIHKNFETLVEMLPHLLASGEKVKLVMTISSRGIADLTHYNAMMRRIDELGIGEHVHCVGSIAWGQLQHVYSAADVYAFPSLTESFGQTMVEAMSCGLPIVASDVPVNREVLGDAALFFDSLDARACAAEIGRVLADRDGLAATLSQRARTRSRDFSWRSYAEQLLGVFRGIANRS